VFGWILRMTLYRMMVGEFKAMLILFVGLRILTSKCKWGRGKKLPKYCLRDPKVQIVTVGRYCDLKMVVSRTQFLFVWSPCTTA
jgi:hypothetical protein